MITKIVSRLITALFVVGLLGATTACNTMHGLGQDVERGGEKLQKESNENR
jgi:predicted small secreted protein